MVSNNHHLVKPFKIIMCVVQLAAYTAMHSVYFGEPGFIPKLVPALCIIYYILQVYY